MCWGPASSFSAIAATRASYPPPRSSMPIPTRSGARHRPGGEVRSGSRCSPTGLTARPSTTLAATGPTSCFASSCSMSTCWRISRNPPRKGCPKTIPACPEPSDARSTPIGSRPSSWGAGRAAPPCWTGLISRGSGRKSPDNSFAFGRDDPQGLRCPLGAHARRANPRDSFDPNDKQGREITNRHRLLRRGRSYTLGAEGDAPERGLLFACLCADLERQFEFVQQTWINASSFHGLANEADPLLRGHKSPGFTIPTPAGAVQVKGLDRFVTVQGGGYYFLPSRSALAYLRTRCTAPAEVCPRTSIPGREGASGGGRGIGASDISPPLRQLTALLACLLLWT